MRVSFLIPLFNCLALTKAMLASLQATLPAGLDHEIIFVDDGSTDDTRAWLRTFDHDPRFDVILNERNLGYAAANNRAAALARGDLLVLLNNDLILTPGWLEPMLAAQASLPLPGPIGNIQLDARSGTVDHAGIFINASGKPEHIRRLPHVSFSPKIVAAATGACLLVARPLWQSLGGFDEGFINGCEDVDLCLRARATGRTTIIAPRSIVRHHVSASPGRKRRDEHNTRRLVDRWREELVVLGAQHWCRRHLALALAGTDPLARQSELLDISLCAAGLRQTPPQPAIAGMRASLARESARWLDLLGG